MIVMWQCKWCLESFNFGKKDRSAKANHTRWCTHNTESNKQSWSKGLTNPKVITDATKLKLSLAHRGRPGTFTGKQHTETSKLKISQAMMGNRNGNHRGDRQSFYKNIRMDSSWEVGVAQFLDAQGTQWKYGERGYILSDGRWYYPDFFVYQGQPLDYIIEVKGYFRRANKEKFNMFISEYPTVPILLWEKDTLYKLGIIDSSGYLTHNK